MQKFFSEQLSSVDAARTQLEAAIDFARECDVLVITKIDRIAALLRTFCEIEARGREIAEAKRAIAGDH